MTTQHATIIATYTRTQAIEDGFLCPVDAKLAREAGFNWPVALTSALFNALVVEDDPAPGQSLEGRLWDVLYMARNQIQRSARRDPNNSDDLRYQVVIVHHRERFQALRKHVPKDRRRRGEWLWGREYRQQHWDLRIVCGPDDHGTPCITIGFDHGDEW